ncbi:hypothetical protein PACTADRAFT_4954 [Pachysolen tannophilus NRRL Y-2460]|uniref:Uncharacterized protein n=1 Tax=Pachysolen tannophilus NRRL Y-2460 TaxID=669874 RepID=A0A1E4TN61_PACTA|nr:hypothetical protein PACTADRAFT_4954 [Pachysolen tannophilus NRRL Y-2460]
MIGLIILIYNVVFSVLDFLIISPLLTFFSNVFHIVTLPLVLSLKLFYFITYFLGISSSPSLESHRFNLSLVLESCHFLFKFLYQSIMFGFVIGLITGINLVIIKYLFTFKNTTIHLFSIRGTIFNILNFIKQNSWDRLKLNFDIIYSTQKENIINKVIMDNNKKYDEIFDILNTNPKKASSDIDEIHAISAEDDDHTIYEDDDGYNLPSFTIDDNHNLSQKDTDQDGTLDFQNKQQEQQDASNASIMSVPSSSIFSTADMVDTISTKQTTLFSSGISRTNQDTLNTIRVRKKIKGNNDEDKVDFRTLFNENGTQKMGDIEDRKNGSNNNNNNIISSILEEEIEENQEKDNKGEEIFFDCLSEPT